jgi:hypothetical protein
MWRSTLRRWLGAAALVPVLAMGCASQGKHCATCGQQAPVAVRTVPAAPAAPARPQYAQAPAMVYQSPYLVYPAPAAVYQPPRFAPGPGTAQVVVAAKPPSSEPADAAPEKPAWVVVTTDMREPPVKRRTYTDITADPAFAHAPNYSWLVGMLEPGRERDTWCLRFCSVDEEDRYGGSVTLVNAGPTSEFQYGRLARVEGELLQSDSQGLKPEYRVRSLKLLK